MALVWFRDKLRTAIWFSFCLNILNSFQICNLHSESINDQRHVLVTSVNFIFCHQIAICIFCYPTHVNPIFIIKFAQPFLRIFCAANLNHTSMFWNYLFAIDTKLCTIFCWIRKSKLLHTDQSENVSETLHFFIF